MFSADPRLIIYRLLSGGGVFRAGEYLNHVVDEASLEHPDFIKSTKLRQYIATTIQVCSQKLCTNDMHVCKKLYYISEKAT